MARYVSPKPTITYKRAKPLRDHLTKSHLPKGSTSSQTHYRPKNRGTFPCGKCEFCEWIKPNRYIILPNISTWTPQYPIDCQTVGVVYIMTFKCKAFYVGKTRRPFWKWILTLQASRSPGLNKCVSYKPFLRVEINILLAVPT